MKIQNILSILNGFNQDATVENIISSINDNLEAVNAINYCVIENRLNIVSTMNNGFGIVLEDADTTEDKDLTTFDLTSAIETLTLTNVNDLVQFFNSFDLDMEVRSLIKLNNTSSLVNTIFFDSIDLKTSRLAPHGDLVQFVQYIPESYDFFRLPTTLKGN